MGFFFYSKIKNTGEIRENILKGRQRDRMGKYGKIPEKTGGLTGMDTGKTVRQFYTDYIIR